VGVVRTDHSSERFCIGPSLVASGATWVFRSLDEEGVIAALLG
jgi:hypothetical protein